MKVLAWKVEEAIRCSVCGTYPHEWEHDRNAYKPEAFRCEGCEAIEAEQDAWHQDDGSSFGVKFRLRKAD